MEPGNRIWEIQPHECSLVKKIDIELQVVEHPSKKASDYVDEIGKWIYTKMFYIKIKYLSVHISLFMIPSLNDFFN